MENNSKVITLEDVRANAEIQSLIRTSSSVLIAMNYTEHGLRHATYVSETAGKILYYLGYGQRMQEIARIAGFVHDIGNSINRVNHGIMSASLVYPILKEMGMPFDEIGLICSACGNHEEEIGTVISEVSAALVLADKSDAHRTRVTRTNLKAIDIHDRVNFAIKKNIVEVDGNERTINSRFYMDETSSVMDYFKIYLPRIIMSEKAAKFLGCTYRLYINEVLINSPKPLCQDEIKQVLESMPEDKLLGE